MFSHLFFQNSIKAALWAFGVITRANTDWIFFWIHTVLFLQPVSRMNPPQVFLKVVSFDIRSADAAPYFRRVILGQVFLEVAKLDHDSAPWALRGS